MPVPLAKAPWSERLSVIVPRTRWPNAPEGVLEQRRVKGDWPRNRSVRIAFRTAIKGPQLRSTTLSRSRSAGRTTTTTSDAFAYRVTGFEPKSNLRRGLLVNNSRGDPSPNPWTWHPHQPGVTTAWLAHVNGVCVRTISRWRGKSKPAGADISLMTARVGLEMAVLRRPGGVLQLWSRMAIAELAWEGASYAELAKQFRCGKSTVWRCVREWRGDID